MLLEYVTLLVLSLKSSGVELCLYTVQLLTVSAGSDRGPSVSPREYTRGCGLNPFSKLQLSLSEGYEDSSRRCLYCQVAV